LPKKLNINESFICRLWEGGRRYLIDLQTTDGDAVNIIEYGKRNSDSGPDYKGAKITIGSKTFSGDIEIHRDFNSWFEHSHDKDSAYNSVILHVVLWKEGAENLPKLRKKRFLPTVVLSDYLNSSIHEIWREIIANPSEKFRIQCHAKNSDVTPAALDLFLSGLAMERLNTKAVRFKERLSELAVSADVNYKRKPALWEQVLYEFLFEALGYSKNKEQMLRLAQIVKLDLLRKAVKSFDSKELQALLYGVSGLMFDLRYKDEYIAGVKESWNRLKETLRVPLMHKSEWMFFRLRPQNFPTIRIACGAQLITKIAKHNLLKSIILLFKTKDFRAAACYDGLRRLLEPGPDAYWSHHYNFGKPSASVNKLLGSERIADITVNVIIPLVYLYGEEFNDENIMKNARELFNSLKLHTKNSVIKMMASQLPVNRFNAARASVQQALLQLYNFYCIREKCRECVIGKSLSSAKAFDYRIIFY
jgi:hypothetical protein